MFFRASKVGPYAYASRARLQLPKSAAEKGDMRRNKGNMKSGKVSKDTMDESGTEIEIGKGGGESSDGGDSDSGSDDAEMGGVDDAETTVDDNDNNDTATTTTAKKRKSEAGMSPTMNKKLTKKKAGKTAAASADDNKKSAAENLSSKPGPAAPPGGDDLAHAYPQGTLHRCRVVGHSYFDNVLLVSTLKRTLRQRIVGVEDARPGMRVTGRVMCVKPMGVYVKVYGHINGFIPLLHTGRFCLWRGEGGGRRVGGWRYRRCCEVGVYSCVVALVPFQYELWIILDPKIV